MTAPPTTRSQPASRSLTTSAGSQLAELASARRCWLTGPSRPELRLLGHHHNPRGGPHQRHRLAGGLLNVDPWRRWDPARFPVRAGAVEGPVPDHDPARLQHQTLVLGDGLATSRRRPRDALREEPPRPRLLRSSQQVAGSLGADPVVARGELRNPITLIGKVGELVHHQFWPEPLHCLGQGARIEYVTHHRFSLELPQRLYLLRRPGHPRHLVPIADEQRDQPP